jgi:zinc/manganese transport system substrate-binding protein/manganese/iron transport system substrate-binding protein
MRTIPTLVRVALVAGLAVALVGCGDSGNGNDSSAGDGKLSVVTTTTQLTDFARQVGGDHVTVYGVLKPNVDPHDFEPSPVDVERLHDADVIVTNGVGLEKWFDATIDSADPTGTVVVASKGIELRTGEGDEHDPHVWQNPRNAELMVANIAQALKRADPDHAADYDANTDAYDARLEQLDRDIAAQLATLTNKSIVTNHDALGYYVDRYGLTFVGSVIPSFDSQADLSAQEVNRIVDEIRRTGAKAVFSETAVPGKTARTIADEAHVDVVAGEDSLYTDSLGPKGSAGDTYLKAMRHNTEEIVAHLR